MMLLSTAAIMCGVVATGLVSAFEMRVESMIQAEDSENTKQHCLVFEDHFNRLDLSKWQHEITMSGGGNWEFEWYTNNRSNSFVEDGILYIKPTLTADAIGHNEMKQGGYLNLWSGEPSMSCTDNSNYGCERLAGAGGNYLNPIQSARLRTINSAAIRYGKVEVRARLPEGDWLWPAIWMMPKYSNYGLWPASGEIDIMESRGNRNYPLGGINNVASTLHWGVHYTMNRYNMTRAEAILEDGTTFADDFHTYGLEWNEDGLRTYIDGKTVLLLDFDQSFWDRGEFPEWSMNPWKSGDIGAPFDQEFYLVLNLAVGGVNGYWPDGHGKPWQNDDPHAVNAFWDSRDQWLPTWGEGNKRALAVDWVKMWSVDTEC
ncbi:beta--glucan-binding [Lichtheimia corymbifera JMRC:FSU:9682]|uniref:Beta--glucan-binding n=1 Tax=Lichtheimia corymbifera JMRC:FSU:9682 TaxID=1263082 RepID=A0A068S7W9_9FUNG|nr:beta--glucan-binding [Lichtheimia corymbifera JMRC:FSU:9682]